MDELCTLTLRRVTDRFFVAALCTASFVCLTLTGCGQGRTSAGATASGTITVQGVPLSGGTVAFSPVGAGSSAFGHIHPDGTYEVETNSQTIGLAPGDYQIAIYYTPEETEDAAGNAVVGENPIARKYADFDRSGLKVTAQAGENLFDFDLEPKKAGRKK